MPSVDPRAARASANASSIPAGFLPSRLRHRGLAATATADVRRHYAHESARVEAGGHAASLPEASSRTAPSFTPGARRRHRRLALDRGLPQRGHVETVGPGDTHR
jgi:hypothetical protein